MEMAHRITESVYTLGNVMMPGYLIVGPELCIVIDAGMTIMGPIYKEEILSCLEKHNTQIYLLLTHSHYDHIGSVSYLKKHLPAFKVGGYFTIDELLKHNNAVELITSLNRDGEDMMNINDPDISFKPFNLDLLLKGGEVFNTGNDELEVIYTPGHTKDSMCYYLRKQKIMFTGESAGIMLPSGDILPEFLTSYKAYLHTLQTLIHYPIDYIATGHGPVISETQAKTFFERSIEATHAFIKRIKTYYKELNNIDEVVERIKREDYESSGSGQPERAYKINLKAKVTAVVEDK
ncbi:MAG: MBL fold metallo-hydrolase [bacterium]